MAVRLFEGKDHAVSYLQYRVTPHEMISKIMSYVEQKTPQQYKLAVDVGCGPGKGTVLLAPFFTRVVGTDISQAMIERALAKSNPPNISYRRCPAEEMPFASGEVDLVTAMTAAHWFDRPRFLQEVDRVLRPGGCLALLSYTMDMILEYREVSNVLNDICRETNTPKCLCRTECHPVRRTLPVSGFIGMVETFSSYQQLKQKDPSEADHLSNRILTKLLTAMNASCPDTEVVVIVNYFGMLACKPSSE
ncbi:trans-aconitate 3-methyltransferase-like isoform X2 [Xiphophorus couchianus]|uniref:trans-aconitate 3-methyltransferase-like isoform X2 n=1 Tax=Xiphophorus couchianus TaxID=32473 RepID=UPI001016763A|nr:trans-aconitate 3-methyltransferase-like isoform X2 [Xiphophorus couchianus]